MIRWTTLCFCCALAGAWMPGLAQPGKVTVVHLSPEKQNPPVFFERLTRKEGLPKGGIQTVFPDREGYLWISNSTSGIYRYDGKQYKQYRLEQGTSAGVHYFYKAFYDAVGVRWFTMDFSGLACYVPQTDKFVHYPLQHGGETRRVESAAPDRQGRIWLIGRSSQSVNDSAAIFCFDPKTRKYLPYPTKNRQVRVAYGQQKSLTLPVLLGGMAVDAEGRLWIWHLDGKKSGLVRFDPQTDDWVYYPFPGAKEYPAFESVTAAHHDEDGEWLWSSGWGKGILGFNKKKLEWLAFPIARTFMGICNKNKDQLWLTDWGYQGIGLLDLQQGRLWEYGEPWKAEADKKPFFRHRAGMIKDPVSGIVWECGREGLNKIDPNLQNFNRKPDFSSMSTAPFFSVKTFFADTAEQVFYGTAYEEGGGNYFFAYDEKRNAWRSRHFPGKAFYEPGDLLLKDHRGMLLTGSGYADSLYEVNPATLDFKPISIKAENNPRSGLHEIYRGLAMPNGDVWLCSRWTGLYHLNAQRTVLHQYSPLAANPDQPPEAAEVREAALDGQGFVWLAVIGGLVRLEPETKKFRVFRHVPGDSLSLPSDEVLSLALDRQQRLWVGTSAGLCWLDLRKGEPYPVHYVKNAGYYFRRIVLDREGKIWGKVNEGICCYDPVRQHCRLYDEMDGLFSESFDRIGVSPGGEVWLDDKYRFHPDEILKNKRPPRIALTDFKIFGKDAGLPLPIELTDTVYLPHHANFFTLEFAALSLTQPWKNTYRYRLSDFDPAWVEAGARASASYTNVPPGKYLFEVVGINNDGYESEAPRRLYIFIAPPWWATWWFRLLASLAALGMLAGAWRLRSNHLRQQAAIRQKELEVERMQEEFRHHLAETEMTALRAQMNPHFIFNCLNSIKLYTKENDSETATNYLDKFARLIRLVLENSRSEKVSLANELEALELYIQLEAMRFKSKVRYVMDVDSSIDRRYAQIPPLLLQPFVENAIWHGLMHKPEGGTVSIQVREPSEGLLRVSIEDDGVGRKAAAEFNSKSAVKHKSFGMQVTSERLESIYMLFGIKTAVEVVDLVHADGEPGGTRVVLEIPM